MPVQENLGGASPEIFSGGVPVKNNTVYNNSVIFRFQIALDFELEVYVIEFDKILFHRVRAQVGVWCEWVGGLETSTWSNSLTENQQVIGRVVLLTHSAFQMID